MADASGRSSRASSPYDITTPTTVEALQQAAPRRRKISRNEDDEKHLRSKATKPIAEVPPAPESALSIEMLLAAPVAATSVLVVFGLAPAHWWLLLVCLVSTAVLALGLDVVLQMGKDLLAFARGSWSRVPLTDVEWLRQSTANTFANTVQVREKGLKILQYVLKGAAYSKLLSKETTKMCKDLSKTTSIARRFFKFFRWVKHLEDLQEAHDEKSLVMRTLLYVRVGANFGADWAEDVCSLERIGVLPKGTLSVQFMLFAEYCQLVLALVEIFVTSVRARVDHQKLVVATAAADGAVPLKQWRKLALMRLELVKFVSDIGKAIYDCELPFSHEGLFIGCSLFSAIISTHKNMFKVLK